MDIFQAIIIGIIEGFTEFLPISSTGHMIVASKFLGVSQDALTKAYEVIIQFAAIMGVNTAMGGVTPPYASILYLGARIGNVKVTKVIPPAMFLIVTGYVPVVFLTSFWPDLSLYLPRLFGY